VLHYFLSTHGELPKESRKCFLNCALSLAGRHHGPPPFMRVRGGDNHQCNLTIVEIRSMGRNVAARRKRAWPTGLVVR